MSDITTHVLDITCGRPAAGVRIALDIEEGVAPSTTWRRVGEGTTDGDGRLRNLLPQGQRPAAGVYRLSFETGAYYAASGVETFYPVVQIVFRLTRPDEHHHVPLLLSPFGYSTYRGS